MNFSDLRQYLREERDGGGLAAIPDDFYDQVNELLESGDVVLKRNVMRTVTELVERRECKIMNGARLASRSNEILEYPPNLIDEEKYLYRSVFEIPLLSSQFKKK